MAQETNQTQAPLLCSTGCGFYGNPRNNGMCSVCYKDFLQRQNSSGHVSPAGSSAESSVGESLLAQRSDGASVVSPAASSPAHTQPAHCSGTPTASATPEEGSSSGAAVTLTAEQLPTSEPEVVVESSAQTEEKPKPKKNRCFTCNKRVGLTGFDCRCGNVFCCLHRYSDVHNCTFDYKADAAEKIRKENPVIVGEKIKKI
ncbi:LOW QUALITY PROTEIN: AN1-type zinc finger protein 6 [Salarias fasciatus]|uniref:LOW QUALITY PROTEIN: AN1-type zinc finger protein 6 n=1 Tax=Salarias fasciatus TaxID=181472 RepID=UPI0011766A16|nr:LOW QUALITY PROTEIN: AN1-type zinc finger protein 6 [Salarias fasciatus]